MPLSKPRDRLVRAFGKLSKREDKKPKKKSSISQLRAKQSPVASELRRGEWIFFFWLPEGWERVADLHVGHDGALCMCGRILRTAIWRGVDRRR